MRRASKGINQMKKSFAGMGNNMAKVNAGMRGLAIATAPAALGVLFVSKTAADFEAQMSVVQSVLLATKEDMKGLSFVTKQLGATTAFTAKEAGEGAEFLARAGFSMKDVISALPGVLDAAAASGVGLGDAAKIVADNIGAFGLKATKAGEVADALSLTTSLTNTTFLQLGEAMGFVGNAARTAGLSMAETAAAMGVMANVGVRGTRAGTALKNSLAKLAKPTKKALELFGGRNGMDKALFRMVDGQKKLLPLEVIMANIQKVVAKSADPLQATAKAFEIMGLRGSVAFGSFSAALGKETKVTAKNLGRIRKGIAITGEGIKVNIGDSLPSLVALRLQIAGATGTAKKMAKIRLDNVKGQFVLLNSAVSGLAIELGSLVSNELKGFAKKATDIFSVAATAFQSLNAGPEELKILMKGLEENEFKSFFKTAVKMAKGFIEGLDEIKATATEVFNEFKALLKPILGDTNLTAKEFGKLAAKIITVAAIAAPILLGIAAAVFIIGPIIGGIIGFFGLVINIIGVLWGVAQIVFAGISFVIGVLGAPLFAIIAAVVLVGAAFWFFRKEIFTIFGSIGTFISETFSSVMKFMAVEVIEPLTMMFSSMWTNIVDGAIVAFEGLKSFLVGFGSFIIGTFKTVGKLIFEVLTFPIRLVISLIKSLISTIANTTLGKKALSIAGIDVGDLNASLAKLPGVQAIDGGAGVSGDSNAIAGSTVKSKALAQGPSAQQTADALGVSVNKGLTSALGGIGGSQDVNVMVTGEFRMRGNDLNAVVTKSKIRNSKLNGRTIEPNTERKNAANGEQFAGGG